MERAIHPLAQVKYKSVITHKIVIELHAVLSVICITEVNYNECVRLTLACHLLYLALRLTQSPQLTLVF